MPSELSSIPERLQSRVKKKIDLLKLISNNLVPTLRLLASDPKYTSETIRAFITGKGQVNLSDLLERTRQEYKQNILVEGAEKIPQTGGFILAIPHQETYDTTKPNPLWFLTEANHLIGKDRDLTAIIRVDPNRNNSPRDNGKTRICGALGLLPIINGNKPFNSETMNEANKRLENGSVVIIAPEGGQNHKEHTLTKAKTGVGKLALESGFPIVSMAFWEDETGQRNIQIQDPIYVDKNAYGEMDETQKIETQQALSDVVMKQISEALPEQYRGFYK